MAYDVDLSAYGCDCEVIHGDVVADVRSQMLPRDEFSRLADLYKMFSDETRVRTLWALDRSEMCVCDIAALLGMTKSAVSHQLKSLRLCNLVKSRREGKVVYYSLADDHVKDILTRGLDHVNE